MSDLIVDVEVEGTKTSKNVEVRSSELAAVLAAIREIGALGEEAHVFERDAEQELAGDLERRSALAVIVSKCTHVEVTVQFERESIHRKFSPAATIMRVLKWAAGSKEFHLDAAAQAKANLILPGTEEPLARDSTISRYLVRHECSLVLDLTLRDFTNG